jgi:hypothetical protein
MLMPQISLQLWKIWTQKWEINSAWETIGMNIKISANESMLLRMKKPWFDKGCSKSLDEREQAKQQWLHDPSETNGDNLINARCEASRHFWNKKREYLRDKINELAINSKNKNIRDLYKDFRNKRREYLKDKINDVATNSKNKNIRNLYNGKKGFKRGYQPRSNLVKDKNGDLADFQNNLNRRKNYFSRLLDVQCQ